MGSSGRGVGARNPEKLHGVTPHRVPRGALPDRRQRDPGVELVQRELGRGARHGDGTPTGTQAQNPANYVGWQKEQINWLYDSDPNQFPSLVTSASRSRFRDSSLTIRSRYRCR